MKNIKLNQLNSHKLEKPMLVSIKGGREQGDCCCACMYAGCGGSSSDDNSSANNAGGLYSKNSFWCSTGKETTGCN